MPIKITFELSDRDLRYFKRVAADVRGRKRDIDEADLLRTVRKMVDDARAAKAAGFILDRLEQLDEMVDMLEDAEWKMEGKDRSRVVDGLTYFAEAEDLIPDRIPGLGYLDDAIMIELVMRDLHHEIEAYDDFQKFRSSKAKLIGGHGQKASREAWLKARREQLHARMRRRRRSDRSRRGSGSRRASTPFRLF